MDDQVRVALRRGAAVTLGRAACVLVVAGAAYALAQSVSPGPLQRWVWLGASVVLAAVVIASRAPLDRLADRVAYGAAGDPHSRLSGFVERISETLAVDDVLPRVAQTVTQATHSESSDVRLWLGGGVEVREVWPPAAGRATTAVVDVPLRHHGDQVGVLGVASRGQSLSTDARALLERLAGTAGLALANVRLTYDLRHRLAESRDLASHLERSRRRLLSADAEQTERFTDLVEERVRSRLRAVSGCLDRAETGSPDDAVAALEEATGAAATALEELRDIAAGVFPPTLSDNGLRVALETYAQRHDGRVRVAHHGPGRRPPSAVEAAAYLCAVELLEESAATGGGGTVDLGQEDGRLRLCVATDGVPSAATMQLVADRAEASDGVIEPVTDAGTVTVRWAVGEGSGA